MGRAAHAKVADHRHPYLPPVAQDGYQTGITVIRDYLREKRRRATEVFIPLVHHPGEEGQFDFFDVTVEEDGDSRRIWKLVLHLPYSERDFIWLYDSCDQLSWMATLRRRHIFTVCRGG